MSLRQSWAVAALCAVLTVVVCVLVIEALAWYGARPIVNNPRPRPAAVTEPLHINTLYIEAERKHLR